MRGVSFILHRSFRGLIALIVLGLALSQALHRAHAGTDHWKSTSVSFGLLKAFLKNENCHANRVKFIGCIQAVNVLGAQLSPSIEITSFAMKQADPSAIGREIKGFGAVFAAEVSPVKTDPKDGKLAARVKVKARQDLQIHAMTEVYDSGLGRYVGFGKIVEFFASKMNEGTREREAAIAARAINTYYASAVDPHTHIDPAKQHEEWRSNGTSVVLEGIGVIPMAQGSKVALLPLRNGPAIKAGVRMNDELVSIDGQKVDASRMGDVIARLRGAPMSTVTIELIRQGKTISLTLVRDKVEIKNVDSYLLEDTGAKIGYLRVGNFWDGKLCEGLESELKSLEAKGAQSLILDLRGNPGGYVSNASCMMGFFVGPEVVIARIEDLDQGKTDEVLTPKKVPFTTRLPMVTLIDAGSASCSEIVAGALQDLRRSWIAGQRSYGKATMQSDTVWTLGGAVVEKVKLYRTTHRFYQPSGRTNQVVGLIPDFALDPKPGATDEDRFALREAELYTNYLPALGPAWIQPRPDEATRLEKCARGGYADELYRYEQKFGALPPDYQVLKAQDLAACALTGKPSIVP